MAKFKIKLTKQMETDRALCNENSNCENCSCSLGTDDCILNYEVEAKTVRVIKRKTLHLTGLWIFAISFAMMIFTTAMCESDIPFSTIKLMAIVCFCLMTIGFALKTVFKEENSKWTKWDIKKIWKSLRQN